MASLNLSTNGPSIKSSYQGVINGPAPSSNSPTYSQWALFTVQAPLANAFQDSGSKESVLKVENTGDGELSDLVEDFSEGRIQFAFVKVKDPNTGLPKNVLIAWCGGGVPERTKGYFTSHLAAVSKVLHGYHVQITARSDSDLDPTTIIQKVSDASGAKYTAGGASPMPSSGPPPVAKKPAFTPSASSTGSSFNPLVAARNRRDENVDADGWGADAPQVSRSQIERVESAYKPTKVNMAELTSQKQEPSKYNGNNNTASGTSGGGYQPVGKVDIAAIRAASKNQDDFRPTVTKGAYEPIGKVDIAAIRAKAQKPSETAEPAEDTSAPSAPSQSLTDRSAAFNQPAASERLTSLPKPKIANKFGGGSAAGTKPLAPGAFGLTGAVASAPAPVGSAGRSFASSAGKTPAQLWAEKKARERGSSGSGSAIPAAPTSPVTAQKSGSGGGGGGEWKSGYKGKSWNAVETPTYGRSISGQKTGGTDQSTEHTSTEQAQDEEPAPTSGSISAIRDRFKEAPPMGASAPSMPRATTGTSDSAPPPPPSGSRPTGGFALPGLPSRPAADNQEEAEAEEEQAEPERDSSPIRIAAPISRGRVPSLEPAEGRPPPPLPVQEVEKVLPKEHELQDEEETHDLARGASAAVAQESLGQTAPHSSSSTSHKAVVEFDYDKAEDNEIDLKEGEHVTDIDMVDEDWWLGTTAEGARGLFPSNYVKLLEEGGHSGAVAAAPAPHASAAREEVREEPAAASGGAGGSTATALYDYEAAEDNELAFSEGDKINNLTFPDEDWWHGELHGRSGLFPANYVSLDS